jgi:glycosyltransferase involved in cell wall biosynthesis
MSCGIPVVAFDCDNGPRNIVKNDIDGLLAQNGNVDDLAAKMNKMIDNTSLRQEMGLRARQNVERFRDKYVFKQYLELYRQL